MPETIGDKLKDFAGNTSIHGFGRIADSVFILRKVFWICALSASFGMCVFQVYRLSLQYISEGVNTKVSVSYKELEFPAVTICNLNPLKLSDVLLEPDLFQILNETEHAFGMSINYPYPKTSFPHTVPYDTGFSPMHTAKEVFRLRMGNYTKDEIVNMSIPMHEFILLCRFQGAACEATETTQIRDEDYGICYTFAPKIPIAKLAGPSMGLEFILNVHQQEYIPFITDSSGIRVAIHNRKYSPDIRGSGISIATSVETSIALTQRSFIRHPGRDGSQCDKDNKYSAILVCMEKCIGKGVANTCGCLSSWLHGADKVETMCSTPAEIHCMKQVQSAISSFSAEDCDCKVPCREVAYNKEVSTTAYPAVNQQGVLEVILNTDSASFGALRESIVYLKVYLASLTDELTEEELAYTEENFVSDIGGQLGLWVGMSVLSITEVVELIILLCIWCGSRKKDSKTDVENFDKKRSSIANS
ncbi:acid-sensing ion channel 5 [Mytilus galloprovincialis]|uniref:Acid-sensing ion channel 5 n=1 Tax=Mytilus galloprovincialis TaxID=29158 RepID=A0A8B6FMM5_MYTGA|nr:acid-sensing ion channel 5 [Mytilus galloprovincialis]